MFNLFSKVKKAIAPKEDTNVVIERIHNEFDSAGERLLKEAKEILSQKVDVSKGERLRNLGFSNSKTAIEAAAKIKEQKDKEELANLIEYYQQWYPFNKFITEPLVKSICEKYNLYSGEVGYYKGDVPEKNLIEIENFKLREEDMQTRSNYDDYVNRRQAMWMMNSLGALGRGQRGTSPSYEPEPPKELITRKVKPQFYICAPEKDFKMAYMRKDGHKLIPDPIVLQPVKGGYLIVSKWGLEASDETLVNEINN